MVIKNNSWNSDYNNAKGSILAGNATRPLALPVGADGTVLAADSTQPTGLGWSSAHFPITPFVVGPAGQAPYQTVQAAINAASTAGGGTVYIQQGTYTENLVLAPAVNLVGINQEGRDAQLGAPVSIPQIIGNVSFTASAGLLVKGLGFISTSGDTVTIAPAASDPCLLIVENCLMVANAGNAFVIDGGAAFAILGFYQSQCGGSANGIQIAGGAAEAIIIESAVTGNTDAILLNSASAICQLSSAAQVIGQDAAINISAAGASVTSFGSSMSSQGTSSAIVFNAVGNVQSVDDQITSSAASGFFISGTGNLSYANITLLGSANQIDSAVTASVLVSRPTATAAATAGAAVRGTASFDSADFSAADGFVSLVGTPGTAWNFVSTNQTGLANNGYACISPGGALTISLPTTSAQGDQFEVVLNGATSWQITQAASQQVFIGNTSTTSGTGGSITTTAQGDALRMVCSVANLQFVVLSSMGNLTVV